MEWVKHEGLGESELTFDLQPSGLLFSTAARLTLPYEPTTDGASDLWPALRIQQGCVSEPTGRIMTNTAVDAEAQTIAADIFHFSSHQVKPGYGCAQRYRCSYRSWLRYHRVDHSGRL